MNRTSGILLPIYSLPSPYGIGTLGKAAYDFVDFLAAAGQSWWQMLPVGPTGYGDSPYQSVSTYAGNPYFIDLDLLKKDRLLTAGELKALPVPADPARVDYDALGAARLSLLRLAWTRGRDRDGGAVEAFTAEHPWVPDYALYMALKAHFDQASWTDWPDADIRLHRPAAVARYRDLLAEDVGFYTYVQFLFYQQWDALRAYAKDKGIGLIGDLPIYVSLDSVDVWAEPQWFQLDENNVPTAVAGVPPDYFSADGQLWGNPLYDWAAMERDGYGWWIRRVAGAQKLYDMVRIDHFRGLESYWAVPYGETTAKNGKWVKGPGLDFVRRITGWFHDMDFIAEDLGILTPEVHELLDASGLPGMKVLEFAFDGGPDNAYLPHNHTRNSVCYVGTHDNAPALAWKDEADKAALKFARSYLHLSKEEPWNEALIRTGLASVSDLFVAQAQDLLGLGAGARTNTPGTVGGNWQWRLLPGQMDKKLAKKLLELTTIYGRVSPSNPAK